MVVGLNDKLPIARCKIYINVKKCEKFFVPKFDGLQKHGSCWKAFVAMLGVTKGQHFVSLTNLHAKNKC